LELLKALVIIAKFTVVATQLISSTGDNCSTSLVHRFKATPYIIADSAKFAAHIVNTISSQAVTIKTDSLGQLVVADIDYRPISTKFETSLAAGKCLLPTNLGLVNLFTGTHLEAKQLRSCFKAESS